MSIPIIDQLRPLGNFPAVDASDVQAGNQRLSTVLSNTPTTTYVDAVVENKVDKVEGKGLSTNDYTNAEKNKLSGIEANANNYVHPTTAGNKHIPSGGSTGKILGWASDGTAQWVDDHNTEYSDATTSTHGLMSASDKSKLNGIAIGATNVTVDSSLNASSTNAIQNKAVYDSLALKANTADVTASLAVKASTLTVDVLTDRVSDVEAEQTALDARMDSFTNLTEGSTTGDAELIDGRVGADGTVYTNIGGAIRGQTSEINENIAQSINEISAEFVLGSLKDNDGLDTASTTRCRCDFVPVNIDSVIRIKSATSTGMGYDVYFFDMHHNWVSTVSHWSDFITTSSPAVKIISAINGYVKIVARLQGDATITNEVLTQIASSFKFVTNKAVHDQKDNNANYEIVKDELKYNKFHPTVTKGSIGSSGEATSSDIRCRTDYIPVIKGTTISFRNVDTDHLNKNIGFAVEYYDADKKFIEEDGSRWSPEIIPSNTAINVTSLYDGFVRILFRVQGNATITDDNVIGFNKVITVDTSDIITAIRSNAAGAVVTFVDGNSTGDATLFEFNNGETMLIDTGDTDSSYEYKMRNNLVSAINDRHIDVFIVSHYHTDHVSNLPELISRGYIDNKTKVYLPMTPTVDLAEYEDSLTKTRYNQTISALSSAGCTVVQPTENTRITIGNAVVTFWNCDHTDYYSRSAPYTTAEYNDCSLCCDVEIGKTRMTFAGDILVNGMKKNAERMKKALIYKANHHSIVGGNTADYGDYWDRVTPDVVFTMAGEIVYAATIPTRQVQTWCNDNCVANFVTGFNGNNIKIAVDGCGYKLLTPSKRYRGLSE